MGAKGALMQLLYQRESTFRTAPVSPDAIALPFTEWNVGRDPQMVKDLSISSSPLAGKGSVGDVTVKGTAKTIFDLRNIGFHLALLLGVPAVHKAVTKAPTNVTGVTIHYAQTACPTGNGTLAFTFSGKTMTWAAQGETAGAAVDVTAGGRFTLQSSAANHAIVIEVAAASLPGSDKTDADLAVSATLKAHVFPFDMAARPSALMELGHSDIGKYYRDLGLMINKLSYDVMAAEQDVDMEYIGGSETEETSVWDATPTTYASVRATGNGCYISNGATSALGVITGGKFAADNGMQGRKVANQQEGFGLIDQGEVALSGNLEVVFDASGAAALARANTSTRMRIGSTASVSGSVFGLCWDMPNVQIIDKMVPKKGKSGIFASYDWAAHRDTAGNLPMVTLINDVAAY
ncbi:MAG: hypothetical protein HY847_01280 [Betaproteobacteria bacterium]|nr:hypothetical protein [Betaproteobacteria bacterium]